MTIVALYVHLGNVKSQLKQAKEQHAQDTAKWEDVASQHQLIVSRLTLERDSLASKLKSMTTFEWAKQRLIEKEKAEPKKKPSNVVVLDLEATCCWQPGTQPADSTQEIIEIGAVRFVDGKQVDTFQIYVKPSINTTLSDGCTALTGITQEQIDAAPLFDEAIGKFITWAGANPWLVSWGHYDRQQLAIDCGRYGIDTRWLHRHTSIKHEYMRINKTRPMGVGAAIRKEGLKFEGRPHSGFDDAVNIAKIFNLYADRIKYTEQTSLTKHNK